MRKCSGSNNQLKHGKRHCPSARNTLGCMIFGKASIERIQLNEDSLWYGGPMERNILNRLSIWMKLEAWYFRGTSGGQNSYSTAEADTCRMLINKSDLYTPTSVNYKPTSPTFLSIMFIYMAENNNYV